MDAPMTTGDSPGGEPPGTAMPDEPAASQAATIEAAGTSGSPGPDGSAEAPPGEPGQHSVDLVAALAAAEQRIADLESGLAEAERQRDVHRAELAQAVERYRSVVLASCPEIPAELVEGETIEAVDASLSRAKALVDRIARSLAGSTAPIPNGAPPRRGLDLSSLTPLEKIRLGLGLG